RILRRGDLLGRYLSLKTGERVLDLGCGTGTLLEQLPACDYLGLDINHRYIDFAKLRYHDRGRFSCRDVRDGLFSDEPAFDLVVMNGFLHHLDDPSASTALKVARAALKTTGRMVLVEPCFSAEQPRLARLLITIDRGQHVRTLAGY